MISLFRTIWAPGWTLHIIVAAMILVAAVGVNLWADTLRRTEREMMAQAQVTSLSNSARRLEAEGAEAQMRNVAQTAKVQSAVAAVARRATVDAAAAPDAEAALSSDRVQRLRSADEALCRLNMMDGCSGAEPEKSP